MVKTTMKELTYINVLSIAKLQSIIILVIGFITGFIKLILLLFKASLGWLDALALIIFIPIAYGIVGFLGGALGAWLYNIFSKKIGGIKFSMK